METFFLLNFMILLAQNDYFFYAGALQTSSTRNPLYIKNGKYLNLTCDVDQEAASVIWNRNGFPVLQIRNATICSFRTLSVPDTYTYNVTCDQRRRFIVLKYGFNSSDDNTDWSCQVNALDGSDLGTSSSVRVYIYKFPSNLSIVGNFTGVLYDGDNVTLLVSTGCINPSDSANYNVTWKYVEANDTAEKNFENMPYVNSSGGCTNTYEKNLTFSLIVTNAINTGNTKLYISQVKMMFTMAGEDFIATRNVSYTLTPKDKTENTTEENNTGKIVGGTVGGFFGVCLLLLAGRVIYVFYKIKKEGKPALGVKALIKKILICDFCSRICDKQKTNSVGGDHAIVSKQGKPHGGNGSKSRKPGDGNGQEKSTESEPKNSMSDVSRNDVQIQMEEGHVKLYVESPQVNPSRLGHQDEANHKSVQSKPFDQKESRPLPPQPGNNNQNKRGISANFDDKQGLAHDTPQAPKLAQSLAHDTPRAINLAPIDPQLLSNKQNEGTSENSRKKKKKKKNKNKKTDEIKSTDDLGE